MNEPTILPHNAKAASTWSAPGERYDEISRGLSEAVEHAIDRLRIGAGEEVLDLACGTGFASRAVATRCPGAIVQGADIASGLLEAARALADRARLPIRYGVGDAEKLPFRDAAFDVVLSSFGIMFASRPEAAAQELTRIVKKGGRIGLLLWKPDGTVFDMFKVMRAYMPAPADPPPASPFAWGSRDRVKALLGAAFDLKFEEGIACLRAPSAAAAWEIWTNDYGPTRALAASLGPEGLASFRLDMIAFHEKFSTELGISKPREYLLAVGVKR